MAENSDDDFEFNVYSKNPVYPSKSNLKLKEGGDDNEEFDELYQKDVVPKKKKKLKSRTIKAVGTKNGKLKEVPRLEMKQEAHLVTKIAFKSPPRLPEMPDKTPNQVTVYYALCNVHCVMCTLCAL